MIAYAALAPHPPLLIPDIGGNRLNEVKATVQGMKALASEVASSSPDCLVFLTPHGNVFSDCISALSEKQIIGSLASFGSRFQVHIENDLVLLQSIAQECIEQDLGFVLLDRDIAVRNRLNAELDHGILVPLYYLWEAGLTQLPMLAISIGYLSDMELYRFGQVIQDAAGNIGRRIAVIASGDMSHRLKDEGPYDFHPDGPVFDHKVGQLLEAGDFSSLMELPEGLRSNAGECGFRSLLIMMGSLDGFEVEARVFSYEGPLGVGYLIAGVKPRGRTESLWNQLREKEKIHLEELKAQESFPVKWARMVLESHLKGLARPSLPDEWKGMEKCRAGAFVSLKKNGQLRGCIGTIQPVHRNLAEEIAANAVSAGSRDPRFLPVSLTEMDELVYSVDKLGEAEQCTVKDLDPKKYGVIVSLDKRRGLLLPDLEGVDSVEQQLGIVLQKAGIHHGEPYSIERFEVTRYK